MIYLADPPNQVLAIRAETQVVQQDIPGRRKDPARVFAAERRVDREHAGANLLGGLSAQQDVNSHARARIQENTQEVATDCAGGSGKEYIHVEWLACRAGNLTILLILLRCAMSHVPHLKTVLPFSVQNRGRMPVDGRLDIRLN
jgi:hypothetical protein